MAPINATEPQTTFLDLPAELRNRIYDLSGCLQIVRCSRPGCDRVTRRDFAERYFLLCNDAWHTCRCSTDGANWALIPSDIEPTEFYTRSLDTYDYPTGYLDRMASLGSTIFFTHADRYSFPPAAVQPALTRVCRAIREETLPMFYGSNRFILSGEYHHYENALPGKFFEMIGRHNTALLRNFITGVRYDDAMSDVAVKYAQQRRDKNFADLGLRPGAFPHVNEKQLKELTGGELLQSWTMVFGRSSSIDWIRRLEAKLLRSD